MLRGLADVTLPLSSIFDGLLLFLEHLELLENAHNCATLGSKPEHEAPVPRIGNFTPQRDFVIGLKSSAEVLQNRIRGVIDLVSDLLKCVKDKELSRSS